MSSIRYKHNYRFVTLYPSITPDRLGNLISGNTIPALLKNGDQKFAPYKGSIDIKECDGLQRVKLVHIKGWSPTDGETGLWYDMPPEHYIVGAYKNDGYYIVLFDNMPKPVALT
ncbi:hypothetical protein [Vibrio superstes]|uniref:Uncharacterized protein n=1 Tax=Vibrio superstes NBRC 103154 TaxID=1219062 RepID=A0A511QQE8_9VIBR|nr:hypothetical protein [Vibrio superstes]GEM79574.1 hypothetical protein VSU01S_18190 [Vibrio superstes NBRC 103154]